MIQRARGTLNFCASVWMLRCEDMTGGQTTQFKPCMSFLFSLLNNVTLITNNTDWYDDTINTVMLTSRNSVIKPAAQYDHFHVTAVT